MSYTSYAYCYYENLKFSNGELTFEEFDSYDRVAYMPLWLDYEKSWVYGTPTIENFENLFYQEEYEVSYVDGDIIKAIYYDKNVVNPTDDNVQNLKADADATMNLAYSHYVAKYSNAIFSSLEYYGWKYDNNNKDLIFIYHTSAKHKYTYSNKYYDSVDYYFAVVYDVMQDSDGNIVSIGENGLLFNEDDYGRLGANTYEKFYGFNDYDSLVKFFGTAKYKEMYE